MAMPYENTSAGDKALGELQKILRGFGCEEFGSMVNDREGFLLVQFVYRGQRVSVKASMKGYAQQWLKANPWSNRKTIGKEAWERKAFDIASVAVYSILRDWIKGQVMAIETGILSFHGAFMAQMVLPGGTSTMEEYVTTKKLLPALEGPR